MHKDALKILSSLVGKAESGVVGSSQKAHDRGMDDKTWDIMEKT